MRCIWYSSGKVRLCCGDELIPQISGLAPQRFIVPSCYTPKADWWQSSPHILSQYTGHWVLRHLVNWGVNTWLSGLLHPSASLFCLLRTLVITWGPSESCRFDFSSQSPLVSSQIQNPFSPVKYHSQIPGLRTWTLWEVITLSSFKLRTLFLIEKQTQ